jgi:integrase
VVLRRYAPSFKYDVKLPQKKKAKIYIPTEEEVKRLIEYVKDTPSYIPILLATCYGFRRSEICGLKWSHVDFDRKTITIECAKVIDKYNKPVEKDPKSYAGYRTLPLSDFLCEVLKAEKEKSTTENITTLSGSAIYNRFKRVLKKLGIPHFRFHDLRHSYAVVSIKAGDPIKTVQENLGHATAAFTLDVYGHVTDQMKQESAARMEQFIKAVNS